MLLVDHANHLLSVYLQRNASCDRRCQPTARDRRDGPLTNELAGRQECNRRLFPGIRHDGKLCTAFLKIEDGVGDIFLREQGLFRLQMNDSLP